MKQLFLIICLVLVLTGIVHADSEAKYVGREACEQCHQRQVELWKGSHHDLAMQPASPETVLADFSGSIFNYAGVTTTLYKKDGNFMVSTDGPDGKLHDYQIQYTFGVIPLQQYLVELDKGRLQALNIAWDARPKSAGGQRWFHLYPDEKITAADELHWTRASFNWNGMCAECHSTNISRNYDSNTDSFQTSWSEIDVSCEACHGPASNHITWAQKKPGWEALETNKGLTVLLDERKAITWAVNSKSGNAQRSTKRTTEKEIEVCAQCHARRSPITDDYLPGRAFADHYMPRLLDEGMYFADGQIQEEVYVYGSFLQSRMYHSGVTCSDCHEPHSLVLRVEGNGVCLQCHSATKFDSPAHHHHEAGSQGAMCAECHMPPRTYMVVDPRHDHSLRIPVPDTSGKLGTPNACNNCHADKGASWAVTSMQQWQADFKTGYQQFAGALQAGRQRSADAGKQLLAVIGDTDTPAIARATALSLLPPYMDQSSIKVLQSGLQEKNVLMRIAAVGALETLPAQYRVQLAYPMLSDEARAVRIEAARILASLPAGNLPLSQRKLIDKATAEYVHSQQVNADRPQAQVNLGNYYVARQDFEKAETAYRKAMSLDSSFIAASINLADLYRLQTNNEAARNVLLQAKQQSPENADIRHALGLAYVRLQQNDKALAEFEAAARLAPGNVVYSYVYAVALNSANMPEQAIKVMQQAQERFPDNRDILAALVAFHRDAGNDFTSSVYMKKLQQLEAQGQ